MFQGALWAILIGIFTDLFYFAGVSLRNLGFFTIFFSLSAPLFWFNYMGVENLLLAGVMVLLIGARRRGGLGRYVVALVLAGVIPLIKLTGGLLGLRSGAGIPGGQGNPRSETSEERSYSGCWSCRWPPPGSAAGFCFRQWIR